MNASRAGRSAGSRRVTGGDAVHQAQVAEAMIWMQEMPRPEAVAKTRVPVAIQCGIYILYSGDRAVYVGQSVNVASRVGAHLAEKRGKFDSYAFVPCPEKQLAVVEAAYILALRPKLNFGYLTGALNVPLTPAQLESWLDGMTSGRHTRYNPA